MSLSAAIFILTQNNEIRKTYLKTTLYFLFRNFNAKYQYPVVILHEGDYDERAQREILLGIREKCRHLVSFVTLDPHDFDIPDYVDKDRMAKTIALKPVPYWRNKRYRLMCRWWMIHFPKYAKKYDYVMRIDDDSIIEEPIEYDLFKWMKDQDLVYSSNLVHVDCGICNYGMDKLFVSLFPDKQDLLHKLFVPSTVTKELGQLYTNVCKLLQLNGEDITEGNAINHMMPTMYYNNFFITQTKFWLRDDVQKIVDAVDKNGGIFYYRWGDAPLQSIIVIAMENPSKIKRAVFKYSKRLQREAFKDDAGNLESYMPSTYDKSSCMIQDAN